MTIDITTYNRILVSTATIATVMAKLRAMRIDERRDIGRVDAAMFATICHVSVHGLDRDAGFIIGFSDDGKKIIKRECQHCVRRRRTAMRNLVLRRKHKDKKL